MKFTPFLVFVVIVCNSAAAQKKMLYPGLEKGKYDIGYKTMIDYDYSRTYNLSYPADTVSQKHDPRPIITNIWYPAMKAAKDKPMLYGDYIKVQTQDLTLKNFIKRIEEYNAENSKFYSFYERELNADQQKKYTAQLNLPIDVVRDAVPLTGKFPLVIYHAGLGGTLNDNTILCEYLASHGFVVVSGAFQGNDYKDVDLDWDLERSRKDLDFMLNKIKNLPFIDFAKVAAIGHSYGAQAVLAYRTEDFSPVSCLIIIDTTMDYSYDAMPDDFEDLTRVLYAKIKNLNVPMLVFANPNARFRVVDSLKYSDRIYATVDLEHNDFTSLTALAKRNDLMRRDNPDTVWAKYATVVNYCLNYLNYNINNDNSAKQFVLSKHPFFNVSEVPKGKALAIKIPVYTDYSKMPTEGQIEKLAFDENIEGLDKVFSTHGASLNENHVYNAGYAVLKRHIDVSIYLFKKNAELHPESANVWDSLGEGYYAKGEKELALKSYKKSVELNPKNENGLRMIEKLSK